MSGRRPADGSPVRRPVALKRAATLDAPAFKRLADKQEPLLPSVREDSRGAALSPCSGRLMFGSRQVSPDEDSDIGRRQLDGRPSYHPLMKMSVDWKLEEEEELADGISESEDEDGHELILRSTSMGSEQVGDPRYGSLWQKAVVAIILSNTVVLALEATYITNDHLRSTFQYVEIIFTVVYMVELWFRLVNSGIREFFCGQGKEWNIFDFVITVVGVMDMLTVFILGGNRHSWVAGRLFRALRILRLLRTGRFLREVEATLMIAAEAIIKLSVVVLLVLFVFAMVATQLLWDSKEKDVAAMFSSLGESMWSLFKVMTLDNWVDMLGPVMRQGSIYRGFFVTFIFVGAIALMSLVPAIFIQLKFDQERGEKEKEEHQQEKKIKQRDLEALDTLFSYLDKDDVGAVSLGGAVEVLGCQRHLERMVRDHHGQCLRGAAARHFHQLVHTIQLFLFVLKTQNARNKGMMVRKRDLAEMLDVLGSADSVALWRAVTTTQRDISDVASDLKEDMQDIKRSLLSAIQDAGLGRADGYRRPRSEESSTKADETLSREMQDMKRSLLSAIQDAGLGRADSHRRPRSEDSLRKADETLCGVQKQRQSLAGLPNPPAQRSVSLPSSSSGADVKRESVLGQQKQGQSLAGLPNPPAQCVASLPSTSSGADVKRESVMGQLGNLRQRRESAEAAIAATAQRVTELHQALAANLPSPHLGALDERAEVSFVHEPAGGLLGETSSASLRTKATLSSKPRMVARSPRASARAQLGCSELEYDHVVDEPCLEASKLALTVPHFGEPVCAAPIKAEMGAMLLPEARQAKEDALLQGGQQVLL